MDKKNIFQLLIGLFSYDPIVRHAAKYELARWLVNWIGFRLYNKNLIWEQDEEFLFLKKRFLRDESKQIHERKFNLYYLAKSVQNIEGDTVECGVLKGEGSYYILCANRDKHKVHHVFDSFCGLSKPDVVLDNPMDENAYVWEENDLSIPLEDVRNNLKEFSKIEFYKGWIPSKFEEVKGLKFSFVHIDVDLFQPTYDSLSFFYGNLNSGAVMLCDDYGSSLCPGAKKAFDEYFDDKPENVVHLTTGQGFIIKQ